MYRSCTRVCRGWKQKHIRSNKAFHTCHSWSLGGFISDTRTLPSSRSAKLLCRLFPRWCECGITSFPQALWEIPGGTLPFDRLSISPQSYFYSIDQSLERILSWARTTSSQAITVRLNTVSPRSKVDGCLGTFWQSQYLHVTCLHSRTHTYTYAEFHELM